MYSLKRGYPYKVKVDAHPTGKVDVWFESLDGDTFKARVMKRDQKFIVDRPYYVIDHLKRAQALQGSFNMYMTEFNREDVILTESLGLISQMETAELERVIDSSMPRDIKDLAIITNVENMDPTQLKTFIEGVNPGSGDQNHCFWSDEVLSKLVEKLHEHNMVIKKESDSSFNDLIPNMNVAELREIITDNRLSEYHDDANASLMHLLDSNNKGQRPSLTYQEILNIVRSSDTGMQMSPEVFKSANQELKNIYDHYGSDVMGHMLVAADEAGLPPHMFPEITTMIKKYKAVNPDVFDSQNWELWYGFESDKFFDDKDNRYLNTPEEHGRRRLLRLLKLTKKARSD